MEQPRLFVSRRALGMALDQGVVSLEGESLRVTADPDQVWDITAGVVFEGFRGHEKALAASERLTGQMFSTAELDVLQADHLGSVVIVGERAYDVRSGFIVSLGQQGVPLDRLIFAWAQLSDALADPQ